MSIDSENSGFSPDEAEKPEDQQEERERGFEVGYVCEKGPEREHNEDSYYVDEEKGIFAVFDGMGGHKAGEVASKIAREVVERHFAELDLSQYDLSGMGMKLNEILKEIHEKILKKGNESPELSGMGTTGVICAVINQGEQRVVVTAYAGDSRASKHSEKKGMRDITQDQNLITEFFGSDPNEMFEVRDRFVGVSSGEIKRDDLSGEEQYVFLRRSSIRNSLGVREEMKPELVAGTLSDDDTLIVSSDGAHDYIMRDRFSEILAAIPDSEKAAHALVQEARFNGSSDDATVLVVKSK